MTQEELYQELLERLDKLEQKPDDEKERKGLRDYFAAAALQGLLIAPAGRIPELSESTSKAAYEMADAMLKARESEAA